MGLNPFDETLEEIDQEQAGPAKTNPFADTLKEMDRDGETALRGSVKVATDTNPERRAEALKLSERTGLPVDTIERNLDVIRKRATIADTPYARMLKETPVLAEWAKNPDNAAVAQDDLEQLGALEWLMTAPQRAMSQGINQVRFGQLKTESMFRSLSREEQDLLESYKFHMTLGGELGAGDSWWRSAVTGANQLLPNIAGGAAMAAKYGTAGAVMTGAIGAAGGAVTGPGALATGLAGAGIGLRAGALYGGAKFGFELEAGLALDEYEQFTDETGHPIDPAVARAAALATGVFNAGLEAGQLGVLAKSIPGLSRLTGGAIRTGIKEALKRPTVRAALMASMKNYVGTLTSESAMEVAQRAATILSGELAKVASGQDIEGRTGGQILEDLINEGVGAVQSFGLVSLPGPTMQLAQARRQVAEAEKNVDFFRAVGEGMAASKTAQRAPGAVEQLVERAVANGPAPHVYAPVDTWATYWQTKGQDPAEVAREVTGNPRAYEEAEQTGLLKIPTSAYAVRLAPTEHNEFLTNELKFAPEEMNAREAAEFKEQEAAKVEEQKAAEEASITQQIEQQISERIVGAGVPTTTAAPLAQLMTRGFALAESVGVDPTPLFERYNIQVKRPTSSESAAIRKEPVKITEPAAAPPYDVGDLPLEKQPAADSQDGAGIYTAPPESGAVERREPVISDAIGSSPLMVELARRTVEENAALRGTPADVAHSPQAQALERERVAAYAAWKRAQPGTVDAVPVIEDTSDSQVGTDGNGTERGDGRPDDRRERAPSDERGDEQGGGDGARAQRRRLPTSSELDDITVYADGFKRAAGAADSARLTEEVRRELQRIADELDALPFIERTWNWLTEQAGKFGNAAGGDAEIVPGAAGAPVYGDILDFAPLNKGRGGKLARTVDATRSKVEADVLKVLKTGVIHNNIAEGAVRVAERRAADDYRELTRPMLPPTWGVEAEPEMLAEVSDAIDDALLDADTSFDPSSFNQSMRGLFDEVLEEPAVDTLETGEQQPRLPGAGDVRETNVETPEFEAPFSLTSEVSTAKKGKQKTLFQSAFHGSPHLFEKFSLHAIGSGEGAQAYGWGLYFASKRAVAEDYRKRLTGNASRPGARLLYKGQDAWETLIDELKNEFTAAPAGEERAATRAILNGLDWLYGESTKFPDLAGLRARVEFLIADAEADRKEFAGRNRDLPDLRERQLIDHKDALAALDKYGDVLSVGTIQQAGRLYTVEIPDDDTMLDWDRPVWKQSPQVQAALKAIGVEWVEGYYPTLEDAARLLDAKLSQPDPAGWGSINTDVRETTLEGLALARMGAETLFQSWYDRNGYLLDKDFRERTGRSVYGELVSEAVKTGHGGPDSKVFGIVPMGTAQQRASEKLAAAGVVGIRYLDGFSRGAGDGSHNYVIFDDRLVEVVTYEQRKPINPDLVITHNLTAANLLHAKKMGGLAVPALAVTKSGDALTSFGEITLIGDKAMADPQGYAKTQVFGADVYSPRYPTIHYGIDRAAQKTIGALVAKHKEKTGINYFDLDEIEQKGADGLRSLTAVWVEFLEENGVAVPDKVLDTGKYARAGQVDNFQTRYAMEKAARAAGIDDKFSVFAEKLFESLNPTEKMFKGFTNQGNRSYRPHTLENVIKELKKELRGGETSGNIYGIGQLRSKFTPRFRTVRAIQQAKGQLVTRERFEKVKDEVDAEFFGVVETLKPYYTHSIDPFRITDTVMAVMEETPRRGVTGALKEYGFEDVPLEAKQAVATFIEKLRTLPTEYFEAKIIREVGLEEFAGAVVPEGTDAAVLDVLRSAGLEVTTYAKGDGGPTTEASRRAAVQQLAAQLGDRVLFQPGPDADRRGAIHFGADRSVTIDLFENADLSTFLHETGHFYLELMGDLVAAVSKTAEGERTPAQSRLLADWQTILEQLGAGDRDGITTEHHERFARMFEGYLMEGRAPSIGMQEIFSRFRAWLLPLYKSLKALGAKLTPEVRGVFDRMLATDAEIAAAEARGRFDALFTTAESAGMSPAEFSLYRETVATASRTAREQLEAKLLGEVRREQEADWKQRREEIREQVAGGFFDRPVYRALAAMRFGTNPDGTPLLEGMDVPPLKLSREALVSRYGEDRLRRLPRPFIYTRVGGVDPELVAERFGFSSADELLGAIETTEPLEAAIKREVDRRMLVEHGSMLLDGSVFDEAQLAVANTVRDTVLRQELRALWKLAQQVDPFVKQARKEGQDQLRQERRERDYERRWFEAEAKLKVAIAEGRKQAEIDELQGEVRNLKAKLRGGAAAIRRGIPDAATLQATARARIARTRIADISPALFWSASRRAATKAIEAAARGEYDDAVAAKIDELLNVNLYREAERAKLDVTKRVARAKDLGKPKTQARIGLAGGTFLEQILGILDRYNFATVSAKELAKRARMRDWIEALEAENLPADDLPPEVQDDLRRVDYQTISYEELVGITDGLEQIVHLSQLRNRQLKTEKGEEFSTVRDGVVASIHENNKANPLPVEFDKAEDRKQRIASKYAAHLKMGTIARMLDGGKDGGAFWEAFIRPVNQATDLEASRRQEEAKLLRDLYARFYPGMELGRLKDKVHISAIANSLSKEARLAVALTRGNEDGLARLAADPTRRWTKAGIDAIVATLDRNDLEFVNAVWAHVDRFWPEIAEKQKRVTGLAPAKVEAAPFTVRSIDGTDVEMTGGYYPLLYDHRLTGRAQRNADVSEAKIATAAAYVSSTTKRGHTKARVSNVKLSVRLDLDVIPQHVDQVLHDLTHHEMLIDVARLLRDNKVMEAIYATRGATFFRQLTRGLSAVAVGTAPETDADKAATFMRTGAQIQGLGLNLWTAAQQPLGLFNGMERVGVKWVARGMRRWLSDAASMQSTIQWISANSKFMADRAANGSQDLMQLREQFSNAGGWFDNLLRTVTNDAVTKQHLVNSFLWHIGVMQRVADVPTWLGAYEKAMADPANEGDEARAFALADQAVIDSQGSGHIKDLADVQRGTGLAKLWLTFYSYGSTTINRAAAIADRGARTPLSISTMLGHYLLLYVMPAAATIALSNLVGRRDDDDPEGWLKAIAGETLSGAMNGVMFLRDVGPAIVARTLGTDTGTRGYDGPAGARLLQQIDRVSTQVAQGDADEALVRAIVGLAGLVFRLPTGQAQKSVDGWIAIQDGKTKNPAALLFGPPRKE